MTTKPKSVTATKDKKAWKAAYREMIERARGCESLKKSMLNLGIMSLAKQMNSQARTWRNAAAVVAEHMPNNQK